MFNFFNEMQMPVDVLFLKERAALPERLHLHVPVVLLLFLKPLPYPWASFGWS
jgi:hypothetical protein